MPVFPMRKLRSPGFPRGVSINWWAGSKKKPSTPAAGLRPMERERSNAPHTGSRSASSPRSKAVARARKEAGCFVLNHQRA